MCWRFKGPKARPHTSLGRQAQVIGVGENEGCKPDPIMRKMASGLQPSNVIYIIFPRACALGWYGVAPLALKDQNIATPSLSSYNTEKLMKCFLPEILRGPPEPSPCPPWKDLAVDCNLRFHPHKTTKSHNGFLAAQPRCGTPSLRLFSRVIAASRSCTESLKKKSSSIHSSNARWALRPALSAARVISSRAMAAQRSKRSG